MAHELSPREQVGESRANWRRDDGYKDRHRHDRPPLTRIRRRHRRLCANDMTRAPGQAIYTGMLNPRGGYESDVTVQRIGEERYRIFTGTAAIRRDLGWLKRHLDRERAALRDSTGDFAVIGPMGPAAARIAAEVGTGALNDLGTFRAGEAGIDAPISDDTAVEIDIARRMSPGRVTFQPAFDPGGKRMRRSNF